MVHRLGLGVDGAVEDGPGLHQVDEPARAARARAGCTVGEPPCACVVCACACACVWEGGGGRVRALFIGGKDGGGGLKLRHALW